MQEFQLIEKKIILISPEPWGKNFLSKHHIASELAQRGNKVFFISPVGLVQDNSSVPKNIEVVKYKPIRGLNTLPTFISRWFSKIEINQILKQTGPVDVVWSFDPHRLQFLKQFNASIAIYHAVDNHQTFLEKRVLAESDIFFSNARFTLDKYDHPLKYKIGHGVAPHFFYRVVGEKLPGRHAVKVGYVGNLENKLLDKELLKQLALDNSTVDFCLVGPRGRSNLHPTGDSFINWDALDRQENIHWLGEQPSQKIPSYLAGFDVLLLLYKPDSSGFVVNAHKILEYLSSGKVIISYVQEEYIQHPDLLITGKTGQELKEVFGKVISNLNYYNSAKFMDQRINWAKNNTYEKQIDRIESILRAFCQRR